MRVEQTSPARGLWTWCLGIMTLALCVSLGPNQALAAPTITSPTPGTTLPGSTTTFAWEAGGAVVTEWWLYVGTSPGAADLYDSLSLGTRTSDTVDGLPTDGSTVHVRLWFRVNGAWPFTDFTYTTSASPGRLSAVPPWDQVLPAAARFVLVMGGAAVLDRETGLVWEQRENVPLNTSYSWTQARQECAARTIGGRLGWRLPSIQELASLIDPDNPTGNPDLPPGHPFDIRNGTYASATVDAANPANMWSMDLFQNQPGAILRPKGSPNMVLCVRGAGPLSVY